MAEEKKEPVKRGRRKKEEVELEEKKEPAKRGRRKKVEVETEEVEKKEPVKRGRKKKEELENTEIEKVENFEKEKEEVKVMKETVDLEDTEKEKNIEEKKERNFFEEDKNSDEEILIKNILETKITPLKKMAKEYKIPNFSIMTKHDLVNEILMKKGEENGKTYGFGKLDIINEGSYGFLRQTSVGPDVYVSISQIKRFNLRNGDTVFGELRVPIGTEKNYGILKVLLINGDLPEKSSQRPYFDDLIPSYPDEKINLGKGHIASRIIDLVAPIGKGQRGLIVAPPKAGKTVLLSTLANDIIKYNPEIDVWILLIDERPEEVTDIKENVKDAEVYSATFDEDPRVHTQVTEKVLEMAKEKLKKGKIF